MSGHVPRVPVLILARKAFRHRKMTNHREIEAIAAAHGFVISYPEDLDFVSQAKLLRDARFVLGPEGSAFCLLYFVGRGAKICLFHQETEGLLLYNKCLPLKEVHLTVITGPDTGDHDRRKQDNRNCMIDAEAFRRFLDEWCGPPP
jgi:hypothetical protein